MQPWKNWDPKHPDLYAEVEQTLGRPSCQLPAGRVDVRVSVETEAVLTHLVHQEVGFQVQNSTAQIIFLGPCQYQEWGIYCSVIRDERHLRFLEKKAGVGVEECKSDDANRAIKIYIFA